MKGGSKRSTFERKLTNGKKSYTTVRVGQRRLSVVYEVADLIFKSIFHKALKLF